MMNMAEITNFFFNHWISMVVLGNFLIALSIVFSKIIVSGSISKRPVEPTPYAFYTGFFGILFFLPAIILNNWLKFVNLGLFPAYTGLASGLVMILSLWILYYVLSHSEASRIMTIYVAAMPSFTFLLKYMFLNERLGNLQVLAFILLVIGGVLVTIKQYKGQELGLKDAGLIILAGLGMATGLILVEIASGLQGFGTKWQNFLGAFTWITGGYFLASAVLYLLPGQKEKIIGAEIGKTNWKLFFSEKIFGTSGAELNKFLIYLKGATLVNAFQGVTQFFVLAIAWFLSFLGYPDVLREELKGAVLWLKILAAFFVSIGIFLLVFYG